VLLSNPKTGRLFRISKNVEQIYMSSKIPKVTNEKWFKDIIEKWS